MSVDIWCGDFGNNYTERNNDPHGREFMWSTILSALPVMPASILEIGANRGINLDILSGMVTSRLIGVEPNDLARKHISCESHAGIAQSIPLPNGYAEMVATCGVLIHIPPADLERAYNEIYRVASRYVVCIEYFADKLEEAPYRGHDGLMWKCDFGSLWLPYGMDLLDCGFFWRPETGLDNLTYWVFGK